MPPTYAQNKVHAMRWRARNYEKVKAINRKSKAKADGWKQARKLFLAILRD